MNKKQLLDLLDEVKYADFFSALDENEVKHHQLGTLRKDFIHRGDNETAYNERCREFVNFYLDENGKLAIIPPRLMPYFLFALIGIVLASGAYFAFFHNKTNKNIQVKILTENGKEMPLEWKENSYQTTKSYPSGTKFRLKLQHENPLFVYALSTDHTMEIIQIYPLVDGVSVANTSLAIPTENENDFIQMNTVKGTDILCVLYAQEKLNSKQIKTELQQSSGTLKQRLEKVLGEKLLLPTQAETKTIALNFTNNEAILAVFIQITHE